MLNASEKQKEYTRSILLGAVLGIVLALVFFAGFLLRDYVDVRMSSVFAAPLSDEESYPLLDEVQHLLDQNYLREQPEYSERQYAAIRGLLGSLGDRNTFFIDPPVARSESDVLAGTYGGIGVSLQRSATGEFVVYPFPDSPAAAEGVQDGDILRAINRRILEITEQQDAIDQLLRGEVREDNGVEITVSREGSPDDITVFIPFQVINIPSVLWRVLAEDQRLGYIQILRFTNRTPDELDIAISDLQSTAIEGLVLDLRHNGGGLLQESVQVADRFLEDGVIVYEQTKAEERSFESEGNGSLIDIPLVVLVNGGTASAAEIVAGAIQDRGRGILLGQLTYGKGTIQQIFSLSDQSSVHVTSAEWFTPDHHVIDGVGLQPDIVMIPDETGRDVEIGEAIRHLQEQLEAQGS
ncbi:MAG: S41 family peptidase [Chitinophagaceae bacterium]|nr:S41 family peptidase [Anaerolineae bacterium]